MENITLRISSDYWMKDRGSGYDFRGYAVDLNNSIRLGKGKLSLGNGIYSYDEVKGDNLEDIAHRILMFEKYSKMNSPSYNILLWRGICPKAKHKKEKTGLLTKIPETGVKSRLNKLFNEYYKIKDLVSKKCYNEAYEQISKSPMGSTFLIKIKDKLLKEFYIGLRKINKNNAVKMVKTHFPSNFYYEIETEYLHHLEGKSINKKLSLRAPEISYMP